MSETNINGVWHYKFGSLCQFGMQENSLIYMKGEQKKINYISVKIIETELVSNDILKSFVFGTPN